VVKEAYHPEEPGGGGALDAGEVRAWPLHGLSATPAATLLLVASVSGASRGRATPRAQRLPTCPGGRSTDGMHTSRERSRGYRLQNRCSFLHGVIDRGPAPCSRKHVCSCREKHKAPLPNSTGVRRTFIFCKDSAVWRADAVVRPSVLRLDLEATHRDRLFSATLAGTQTARATTLRTREKIKGNT
jgi:hypothetical protein